MSDDRPSALLLDMDGVLVDSFNVWVQVLARVAPHKRFRGTRGPPDARVEDLDPSISRDRDDHLRTGTNAALVEAPDDETHDVVGVEAPRHEDLGRPLASEGSFREAEDRALLRGLVLRDREELGLDPIGRQGVHDGELDVAPRERPGGRSKNGPDEAAARSRSKDT